MVFTTLFSQQESFLFAQSDMHMEENKTESKDAVPSNKNTKNVRKARKVKRVKRIKKVKKAANDNQDSNGPSTFSSIEIKYEPGPRRAHPLGRDRGDDMKYYNRFSKERKKARKKFTWTVLLSSPLMLTGIFTAPLAIGWSKLYKKWDYKNRFINTIVASYMKSTSRYRNDSNRYLNGFYYHLLRRNPKLKLSKEQVLQCLYRYNIFIGLLEDNAALNYGYRSSSYFLHKISNTILRNLDEYILRYPLLGPCDENFNKRWIKAMSVLLREEKNGRNLEGKVILLEYLSDKVPHSVNDAIDSLALLKLIETHDVEFPFSSADDISDERSFSLKIKGLATRNAPVINHEIFDHIPDA